MDRYGHSSDLIPHSKLYQKNNRNFAFHSSIWMRLDVRDVREDVRRRGERDEKRRCQ